MVSTTVASPVVKDVPSRRLVQFYLEEDLLAELDAWGWEQRVKARTEVVKRLLRYALSKNPSLEETDLT